MAVLDLSSGGSLAWVLGPAHPALQAAAQSHAADASTRLAKALAQATKLEVLSLHATPAAALERATAIARQRTGRAGLVACRGARTADGARVVSHGDPLQAHAAFEKERPCAFVVEVVQASAGTRVPPPGYLERVRKSCDDLGVVLIVDETETGFGRTGTLFAFEREKIVPDLLVLSLAVTPGVSGGALLARPGLNVPADITDEAGAAADATLALLQFLETGAVVAHARKMGKVLQHGVHTILETRRRWSMDTRGRGLLRSLSLWDDPRQVIAACAARGLTIAQTGEAGLLFAPPITATEADLAETLAIVDAVLAEL